MANRRRHLQQWHREICWLRDQYNLSFAEISHVLGLELSGNRASHWYRRFREVAGPPQLTSEHCQAAARIAATRAERTVQATRATRARERVPEPPEPRRDAQWRCIHHLAHNLRFDIAMNGLSRQHAMQFTSLDAYDMAASGLPIPTCERCEPE